MRSAPLGGGTGVRLLPKKMALLPLSDRLSPNTTISPRAGRANSATATSPPASTGQSIKQYLRQRCCPAEGRRASALWR
jgi:hypothetical protein